jgi:hypothetical protein
MSTLTTRFSLLAAAAVVGLASSAFASTIANWTFTAAVASPDNNPAPTVGTGTASSLGMTGYTNAVGLNTSVTDDVTSTSGDSTSSGFAWRIRGNDNGWALSAPQYTQGAEFDVPTTGFNNITVSFDWFSTTQGVADLQEQYTTDGTTWTNINPLLVAVSNGYSNNNVINLSSIPGTSNDPSFGIRLVSAYDPTAGTYLGAAGGTYNNSSGNWRFDNITVAGTAVATPEPASLGLLAVGGLALIARRRK